MVKVLGLMFDIVGSTRGAKMHDLIEIDDCCPYCSESQCFFIDSGDVGQQIIEDCRVCCQPITISVRDDQGTGVVLDLRRSDDVY